MTGECKLCYMMQVKSVLVDRGDQFGVSSVVFDGREEMLWMGNAGVSRTCIFCTFSVVIFPVTTQV